MIDSGDDIVPKLCHFKATYTVHLASARGARVVFSIAWFARTEICSIIIIIMGSHKCMVVDIVFVLLHKLYRNFYTCIKLVFLLIWDPLKRDKIRSFFFFIIIFKIIWPLCLLAIFVWDFKTLFFHSRKTKVVRVLSLTVDIFF